MKILNEFKKNYLADCEGAWVFFGCDNPPHALQANYFLAAIWDSLTHLISVSSNFD